MNIPGVAAETEGSGAYVYAGPVTVGGDVKAGDYSGVYAGVEAGPASIGVAQYAELSPSFEPTQMEPGMGEMGTQGGNLAIYKPTVAVEASVSENGSIYMGYTPATGEAEMILEHAPSWGPEAVSLGVVATAEGVAAADLRADLGRYNIRATYTPNENSVSLSVSKTF